MWTKEHRARQLAFERGRRYPTDLTNEEWAQVEPLLPKPAKRGRKPKVGVVQNLSNSGNTGARGQSAREGRGRCSV